MFASLYMLAMSLTHGHAYARCVGVAEVATWLSQRRDPALYFPALAAQDPDAARAKVARLWVTWTFFESSFRSDVAGDHGRSCGIAQVAPTPSTPSCAEMRRSAYVGMSAGADVLERLTRECGSLRSALGAYASGKCGGAPALVDRRCALAGGC
jgi:hypothetical protein